MLVLRAVGAADPLDDLQLRLGAGDVAFDDIGLAKILADLRVARIERDRSLVVTDPLIDPAELARRIAAIIERLRRIRVAQQIEGRERFVVPAGLGQRGGIISQDLVRQRASLLHAASRAGVPDLAPRAIGRVILAAGIGDGKGRAERQGQGERRGKHRCWSHRNLQINQYA
jgi:hypothetical protein